MYARQCQVTGVSPVSVAGTVLTRTMLTLTMLRPADADTMRFVIHSGLTDAQMSGFRPLPPGGGVAPRERKPG
jgi:hypothetical protein